MSTQTHETTIVAEKVKIDKPIKYNVIIHDNPLTSFEEVIFIVSRCFEKTEQEAEGIASIVHVEKRGVCGTYDKEIAESKLIIVDLAKQYLINNLPHRATGINALKFTMEQA
jgi:ATP-dependent Clp protease adaptor protein ClpS